MKEIFYNFRVCYKFFGKKYKKHIAIWEEQERSGILDTRPPFSRVLWWQLWDFLGSRARQWPTGSLYRRLIFSFVVYDFCFKCKGLKAKIIVAMTAFLFNQLYKTRFSSLSVVQYMNCAISDSLVTGTSRNLRKGKNIIYSLLCLLYQPQFQLFEISLAWQLSTQYCIYERKVRVETQWKRSKCFSSSIRISLQFDQYWDT